MLVSNYGVQIIFFSKICLISLFFNLITNFSANAGFLDGIKSFDKKEYETAYYEFYKAAKSGDELAQFWVGRLYQSGKGVHKSSKTSLKWFRLAAEQGFSEAQYEMGLYYYKGTAVAKDHNIAAKYFQSAAEQGNPGSFVYMDMLYKEGIKFPNVDKLKVKCPSRSSGSMTKRWNCLRKHPQKHNDITNASEWLTNVAKMGNSSAQYYLGYKYSKGLDLKKSYSKALIWHSKAAIQGYRKAKNWVRAMAERGNIDAQHYFGKIYAKSQGNSQDLTKAYMWYIISALNGYEAIEITLYRAKQVLTPDQITEAQNMAAKWLAKNKN